MIVLTLKTFNDNDHSGLGQAAKDLGMKACSLKPGVEAFVPSVLPKFPGMDAVGNGRVFFEKSRQSNIYRSISLIDRKCTLPTNVNGTESRYGVGTPMASR